MLQGDGRDRLAVAAWAALSPSVWRSPIGVWRSDDGRRALAVPPATAAALRRQGISLASSSGFAPEAAPSPVGLLAAIPWQNTPASLHDVADVANEAIFLASTPSSAARLLGRLLHLERLDAQVWQAHPPAHAPTPSLTLVRLRAPPLWLVQRAEDGADADLGVVFATNDGGGVLFGPRGQGHLLASVIAADLIAHDQIGLWWRGAVGDDLLRLPAGGETRSLVDVVTPTLPDNAVRVAWTSTPPTEAFQVPLRLAPHPAASTTPVLFVLDPHELPTLQAFVQGAPPEELERLMLGRVCDLDGRAKTVVRELVRPGVPPIGPRLAMMLARPGYARAVGVDGLYVPPGQALLPMVQLGVKRAALRALLGLSGEDHFGDEAQVAIVDQDADGLRLTVLGTQGEEPLSALTTYMVSDRRRRLDALLEQSVLRFPGVQLPGETPRTPVRAPRRRSPKREAPEARRLARTPLVRERVADTEVVPLDRQQLLDEERTLQRQLVDVLVRSEVDTQPVAPDAWARLTEVKLGLQRDDSLQTAANALFAVDPDHSEGTDAANEDAARIGEAARRWWGRLARPSVNDVDQLASDPRQILLELVVREQLSPQDAVVMVHEVWRLLDAVERGDDVALADELLHQAVMTLARPDIPLPRRLQWRTLRRAAMVHRDPIGLTRAKEAVLGAVNARGVSETLDLPRFVRVATALGGPADDDEQGTPADAGDDADAAEHARAQAGQVKADQLGLLERAYAQLIPEPTTITDGPDAIMKLLFATGFARLGGPAQVIVAQVEEEAPVHDAPVQLLLSLYAARLARRAGQTGQDGVDVDAWRLEVERVLGQAVSTEARNAALWLIKRSRWLAVGDGPAAGPITGVRSALRDGVEQLRRRLADAGSRQIVEVAREGLEALVQASSYDYEVAGVGGAVLQAALETGNDEVVAVVVERTQALAMHLRILAHRARLLGDVVGAAAILANAGSQHDTARVDVILTAIADIARERHAPSVADLLAALRPSLHALRRVGAVDTARRFLGAFERVSAEAHRPAGPLLAAVAEGYVLLGDSDTASQLLSRALQEVELPRVTHIDRYEAGAAICAALAHWPHGERFQVAGMLFGRLRDFHDTFTASRFFPTHQLLMLEHLIECVVDDVTVRGDRLQRVLDDDEARLRSQILIEWRTGMARLGA